MASRGTETGCTRIPRSMRMTKRGGRFVSAFGLPMAVALGVGLAGSVMAAQPIEIRSISLTEDESMSLIDLKSSGRIQWSASYDQAGDLQIRLANTAPSPGLVRELAGERLVSLVRLETRPDEADSSLRITNRGTAGYTVRVRQDGLEITLRALGETKWKSAATSATRGSESSVESPVEPLAKAVEAPAEAVSSPSKGVRNSVLTIGSGDILEVDVLGVDELSRRVRVLSDGTITLPPLGNFNIAGLSVRQAESAIAQLLANHQLVNDPQVSIFVSESVGGGVSVQGAVTQPGVYQLFGRNTLIEVVGQAGGLTRDAGGRILVLRETSDGEQETIDVDVDRLVEEGDASVNVTLFPGDIVVVPRGRQLKVYVTGAVRRPGAVEYSSTEGITVLQAITAAGGPTERANLKKVTVRRRLSDGSEESIRLNVKKIQSGKESDLPLERNDTVVVGEWLL